VMSAFSVICERSTPKTICVRKLNANNQFLAWFGRSFVNFSGMGSPNSGCFAQIHCKNASP